MKYPKKRKWLPTRFIWRITLVNFIVITIAIILSGWAIYHTACFLVDGMGNFTGAGQEQFNATLFQYLILFGGIGVFVGIVVQFYFTKKLLKPIEALVQSTKMLQQGVYPSPIPTEGEDEIAELTKQYNELLLQLQRNEAYRNKLVEDVSHELRTPISNLTGYMHALKSGVMQGNPQLFASLYEQTKRLTDLVEQIEHLNEWDTDQVTPIDKELLPVKQMMQQCVEIFRLQLEENHIALHLEMEEASLWMHQEGIKQVFTNLLDNAIRYYEEEAVIYVTGKRIPNYYQISIATKGAPIESEARKRIFERFYRLEESRDRKTGGSGLGLAIAKEIMENHDGTIGVESQDGFNTFVIQLPVYEEETSLI
ncbi:MAG TPA: ATP-binding protein [Pseudogracilibacillus sp.]|nr:ATP-binding protein [Pseudogracilibacillus sp.]